MDSLYRLAGFVDVDLASWEELGSATDLQRDPAAVALRSRLEADYEATLDRLAAPLLDLVAGDPADAAVRRLAAVDRVPPVYEWVAHGASWHEIVEFIAMEGGPDDSFDDLVAMCQVGMPAEAKLELARNYWDELGNGRPAAVHRELHEQLVRALGVREIPREDLHESGLIRSLLCGFLAATRRLQPELVGALGMIELQAGPRCRRVLHGLARIGAPEEAFPFYEVHAETDPRHGRAWLDHAIVPLARRGWGPGIVRGAAWRVAVNRRFFADVEDRLCPDVAACA